MSTAEEIAMLMGEYIATTAELKACRQRVQSFRQEMTEQMAPLRRRLDELQTAITDYLRCKALQGVRKGKTVCYLTKRPVALPAEQKIARVLQQRQDGAEDNPDVLTQRLLKAMRARSYKDDEFKEVLCLKTEE